MAVKTWIILSLSLFALLHKSKGKLVFYEDTQFKLRSMIIVSWTGFIELVSNITNGKMLRWCSFSKITKRSLETITFLLLKRPRLISVMLCTKVLTSLI